MSEGLAAERVRDVHGDSLEIEHYAGSTRGPTRFRCNECRHRWTTALASVTSVGTGCPKCANRVPLTEREVGHRITEAHGTGIQMVRYGGGVSRPSSFTCSVCRYEWVTSAISLYGSMKTGCPRCSGKAQLTEEEVSARVLDRHGDRIELIQYGGGVYLDSVWACRDCDHEWSARAHSVYYAGTGCPACSRSGLDPAAPASVYYVRVVAEDATVFFKLGITNKSPVVERFTGRDRSRISLLREWRFSLGSDAYGVEQELLERFAGFNAGFDRYTGPLERGGNTELFSIDLLPELDEAMASLREGLP